MFSRFHVPKIYNMKSILYFLLIAMLSSCNFQQAEDKEPAKPAVDQTKELASIMSVIEAETACFYKRDYECWKQYYVQKDYAYQAWNNGDGTADVKIGWEQVDKGIGDYIKANPLNAGETASHPKVERKNLKVHFFTDTLAYLTWDQYNSDQASKIYMLSKDSRLMEKEGDVWKIANVTSYWDYKNTITSDSLSRIK
jgi:hypothetical protein